MMEETITIKPAKHLSLSVIENIANSFGWKTYFSKRIDEDNLDVEFETHTDRNQDLIVSIIIPVGFTMLQLATALYHYWQDFDPDYETSLWTKDGHGVNGAPHELSEVLADMKDAEKMIEHLYNRFRSKANMKKYTNVIFVKTDDEDNEGDND